MSMDALTWRRPAENLSRVLRGVDAQQLARNTVTGAIFMTRLRRAFRTEECMVACHASVDPTDGCKQ
jgi:hypothetical protein